MPKHGIDEGRSRFVVVNKGSLLGEISSTCLAARQRRATSHVGVCFMIKAIPMKTSAQGGRKLIFYGGATVNSEK